MPRLLAPCLNCFENKIIPTFALEKLITITFLLGQLYCCDENSKIASLHYISNKTSKKFSIIGKYLFLTPPTNMIQFRVKKNSCVVQATSKQSDEFIQDYITRLSLKNLNNQPPRWLKGIYSLRLLKTTTLFAKTNCSFCILQFILITRSLRTKQNREEVEQSFSPLRCQNVY